MIAIATSWHFIIILMHPLNCLESPLSTWVVWSLEVYTEMGGIYSGIRGNTDSP